MLRSPEHSQSRPRWGQQTSGSGVAAARSLQHAHAVMLVLGAAQRPLSLLRWMPPSAATMWPRRRLPQALLLQLKVLRPDLLARGLVLLWRLQPLVRAAHLLPLPRCDLPCPCLRQPLRHTWPRLCRLQLAEQAQRTEQELPLRLASAVRRGPWRPPSGASPQRRSGQTCG